MTDTLQKLIDNGILNHVSQITVDGDCVCRSWMIENDLVFKNEQDEDGTEIEFLILEFDDESSSRFRLDTPVIFVDGDLHLKEDYSQSEISIRFQKTVDVFPKDFLNKQ
jgi:hypothetical protein